MKGFDWREDGSVSAELEPEEAEIIRSLAAQVIDLLTGPEDLLFSENGGKDPALARLLPDAYPSDAESTAEFRRYTGQGLTERKIANAAAMAQSLTEAANASQPTEVRLDEVAVQAWLRSLTDIRLVLGERLNITDDYERTDDQDLDDELAMIMNVYDWLGLVQESLLHAIDR